MIKRELPLGYNIRVGIVSEVHSEYCIVDRLDRGVGERSVKCPVPHPYAGRGGGIFAGIEKDTLVLLSSAPQEQWFIVGIIPDTTFFGSVDGVDNIRSHETPYPIVGPGEISLKGNKGQTIELLKDGNIILDAAAGPDAGDFELSNFSRGLFIRVDNTYTFTEAGRSVEGVIKRDQRQEKNDDDSTITDFLSGEAYDRILQQIGRFPDYDVQNRTTNITKSVVRNPALVEKRDIIYEYANSFNVQDFASELRAIITTDQDNLDGNINGLQHDPSNRENRRTDVLDLNARNFNHLIERVQGSLVDIYGNLLDINRNIINIPDIESLNTTTGDPDELKRVYDFLRRSVKYHFEINSRKADYNPDPSITNADSLAREHSKFSVDIDGEGFTKINIPSTSETGNIPILSRYIVSRDPDDLSNGYFIDPENRDVRILQFGQTGKIINNTQYLPQNAKSFAPSATSGTAHHNLFNTASSIFSSGKFKNTDPTSDETTPIMGELLNNQILEVGQSINDLLEDERPNSGGKSLNINMDGSLEMSVGKDTADGKSMVIDLEGGSISHYGRDKNGRSIIHQSDGDVLIQIGGTGVGDDTTNKPGRIEIHLNRPNAPSQKIIIDEDGLTINVQGNAVFSSTGDMTLSSGGKLLLHGELINCFGTHDTEINGDRSIQQTERILSRSGNVII